MSASSSAMMTRIGSLLTGGSLSAAGAVHLPARLLRQPPGTPARPRTPIGRGSGFKTRAVCVRVAPGALHRFVVLPDDDRGHVPFPCCSEPFSAPPRGSLRPPLGGLPRGAALVPASSAAGPALPRGPPRAPPL